MSYSEKALMNTIGYDKYIEMLNLRRNSHEMVDKMMIHLIQTRGDLREFRPTGDITVHDYSTRSKNNIYHSVQNMILFDEMSKEPIVRFDNHACGRTIEDIFISQLNGIIDEIKIMMYSRNNNLSSAVEEYKRTIDMIIALSYLDRIVECKLQTDDQNEWDTTVFDKNLKIIISDFSRIEEGSTYSSSSFSKAGKLLYESKEQVSFYFCSEVLALYALADRDIFK